MDTAVNFDPSSAKPVNAFDASTAKPLRDVREAGPLGTAAAMGRGLIASTLGSLSAPTPIDKIYGLGQSQGGIPYAGTETYEKLLPKPELGQLHPTAQTIGELLPAILPAGAGAKAVKLSEIGSRIIPGATRRAEEKILTLGPSLDKDAIGRGVLSSLHPDYDPLYAERKTLLDKVANDMEEGPAKVAAFRKIYQNPKFAELKRIEENPLGAKVVATTTRYSSVPKINPKDFLKQAFRSPQDVRDLKSLFNGDQAAVEKIATRYVASDLKSVMEQAKTASATEANPFKSEAGNVASALERWRVKNADWLKEVPETKKAVDTFVDNMVAVAKTQKHFKYAMAAGATLGMFEGGFHPFSWLARLFGGVE